MNPNHLSSRQEETNSTFLQDSQSFHDLVRQSNQPKQDIEEQKEQPSQIPLTVEQKLLNAAATNDKAQLHELLLINQNIDISTIANNKKQTLLHFAAFNNHADTIKLIMDHYQTFVNNDNESIQNFVNAMNVNGFTALHFASYRGNIQIIEYLAQIGADLTICNEHGMNMLHIAAQGDMPIAIVFGNEKGLSITEKDNKNGTPLHWACYYGCEQAALYILSMLPQKNPPINDLDLQRWTPLHLAVLSGNTRLVKKLLLYGADKNIRGKNNQTPADLAKENEFNNIHKLLEQKQNIFLLFYNIKQSTQKYTKSSLQLLRFVIIFILEIGSFMLLYFKAETSKNTEEKFALIILILFFITFFWFFFVVYYDPGFMKKQENQSLLNLLKKKECYEICPTCKLVKISRSRHCDICQRCVLVYDHHCPWINNCVSTCLLKIYQ